jgi:prepilin-type N-terminal cleavage/methylation domain-containing protein
VRDQKRQKGFTLIELLVVVGIIIIATAMAMPAINQFLKGQKLAQGGRLVQSAFNEARRAAITQRSRHWIFFGRIGQSGGGVGAEVYALAHYREGKGWDSTQIIKLPSSIVPVFQGDLDGMNPDLWKTTPLADCKLRVQDWTDGLPANTATTVPPGAIPFMDAASLTLANGCDTFEFRKDGTIALKGNAFDVPPAMIPGGSTDLYDANAVIPDAGIPKQTKADIVLRQIGSPEKRCFIDVDLNTGRVRFRVVETSTGTGP